MLLLCFADPFYSPTTKPAKKRSATKKMTASHSSASDSPSSEDEPEPEGDEGSDRERANTVSEATQPEGQGSQRGIPSSNADVREVTKGGWETEDDDKPDADDEGEVVAKPTKKVTNGKRKPVARRTTRKAKAAPTTPDPEVTDEAPPAPKRKAAPPHRSQPKRNGRSQGDVRKAAKAPSSPSSDGASVPAQETPVQSDAEEDANDVRPIPVTPMKKQSK